MQQRRVAIIAGTRPEIVKLAPVWRALQTHAGIDVQWVHTGQHGAMADDMLQCFGIVPDHRLARNGSSLEDFSTACRGQLDALRAAQGWDACIVQGDTESAFLGALCAFYGRIPVAHVEAGLRTHNLDRPFPEEGIRQMISRIACLHFASTEGAGAALLAEGVDPRSIQVTGNTVVDAQRWIAQLHGIRRIADPAQGHILVTAHRREHWGADLQQTFHAVADIAAAFPERQIVFPVHLNPVVREPAHAILGNRPNISLVAPLGYVDMQRALAQAALLLTDSGGLQEEAPTFGVPTLVLRRETERPEAVHAGCALLVGPERDAIVAAATRLLRDRDAAQAMRKAVNPFGDGYAGLRIATAMRRRLGLGPEPVRTPALPPAHRMVPRHRARGAAVAALRASASAAFHAATPDR